MSAMRIVSDDVRQFIVSLYQSGAHTQRMIAEIVGTTQSNISKIISKARRDGMLLPKRNVAIESHESCRTLQASQIAPNGSALILDYL